MIRVTYGDVADFAKMGYAAGRSQAAIREQQQQFQLTSQMMQQQAAADRQRLALEAQRESQEFASFINLEADRRSQAWEFEKIEMTARNRFELEEQSFAMEFQATEAARIQRQQEKEQKINSLRKAARTGQITQAQSEEMILGLDIGVSPNVFEMFRPGKQLSFAEQKIREAMGGEAAPTPSKLGGPEEYEVTDAASRLLSLRSGQTDKVQRNIDLILDKRNLSQMNAAIEELSLGKGIAEYVGKPVTKPTKLPQSVNERVSNLPKNQQKVVERALLEGSPEEQQAAMNALNLVERQKIEADRRKTEIEKTQELTKQREADRKMRKELGIQTVWDRMLDRPSMSLARPIRKPRRPAVTEAEKKRERETSYFMRRTGPGREF